MEVRGGGEPVPSAEPVKIRAPYVPVGARRFRVASTRGLRPDMVLWQGTKGVVNSRIVGGSFLELRLPPVGERKIELKPGELMEGEATASLGTLVVELTDLSRNLNEGVSELRQELKTRGLASVLEHPGVRGALHDFRTALGTFQAASKATQGTLTHGDETLRSLDRNLASLEKSLLVLQGVMERRQPELDTMFQQVGTTLKQLQNVADDVAKLAKTAGPELTEALQALSRTLESTEELVELLKAKPNRVVFGTPSESEREAARKRAEERRAGPIPPSNPPK